MAAARDVDALYQLPPGEFTAARNALATRLKKEGHADEAQRVKQLPKPSVPAWTVNQLYWRHRRAFDQLIAAGERVRNAQLLQLAGKAADVRAPVDASHEAAAELTRLAAARLREAGHNPTPDTMRRITTTLDALATYGTHPSAPPAGRLHAEVEPPGFEVLAGLVARRGRRGRKEGEPPRVLPFRTTAPATRGKGEPRAKRRKEDERKARVAVVRAALHEAERAVREARRNGEQAEAALKKAAARAKETERKKAELEARLEKATAEAERARQEARRVASAAEEAAQAIHEAERAVDTARRQLRELGN